MLFCCFFVIMKVPKKFGNIFKEGNPMKHTRKYRLPLAFLLSLILMSP